LFLKGLSPASRRCHKGAFRAASGLASRSIYNVPTWRIEVAI